MAAAGVAGTLPVARGESDGPRALVCLYLNGGNDSNNMVVPLSSTEYAAYASIRGPLALPAQRLLPIAGRDQTLYGLHPALGELRELYQQGSLAIVANAGPGRVGRLMTHQGSSRLAYLPGGFVTPDWVARWAEVSGAEVLGYTFESGISMVSPGAAAVPGSRHENEQLRLAMNGASAGVRFPATGVGRGLADVAALLEAGGGWGMTQQIFTVPLSGFDTHSRQSERQDALFRQLSQAIGAFHQATEKLGRTGDVTLYTDTEFNRALAPNGKQGTEHGWGGHHLVVGGAVRGGDVYGRYPSIREAVDGILVPGIATEQFTGELAGWAGAGWQHRMELFPKQMNLTRLGIFA